MNRQATNIIVGLAVAGILLYFLEQNTILVTIAIGGLGYLLFANGILGVA